MVGDRNERPLSFKTLLGDPCEYELSFKLKIKAAVWDVLWGHHQALSFTFSHIYLFSL